MEGVSGLNLQMALMAGNISLIANKNVTVSCFPRLCNVTLMSVFTQMSGCRRAHLLLSTAWALAGQHCCHSCSCSPGQLLQGMAPNALVASLLWLPQPPPPTLPIIPMRPIQLGWSFSGPVHPFPELPHWDVPAPHCPVCKWIPSVTRYPQPWFWRSWAAPHQLHLPLSYLITHAQVPLKLLHSKPEAPSPTLPFVAVSKLVAQNPSEDLALVSLKKKHFNSWSLPTQHAGLWCAWTNLPLLWAGLSGAEERRAKMPHIWMKHICCLRKVWHSLGTSWRPLRVVENHPCKRLSGIDGNNQCPRAKWPLVLTYLPSQCHEK